MVAACKIGHVRMRMQGPPQLPIRSDFMMDKCRSSTTYCPHCEERVSIKTFRKHKRLYYSKGHWIKCSDIGKTSSTESFRSEAPELPSDHLLLEDAFHSTEIIEEELDFHEESCTTEG